MAKAYRTVSNDALCIITGLTPIHIKIKETAELYKIVRGNRYKNSLIDHDKPPKQWLHPAARIKATDNKRGDSSPINIYTDGSKSEKRIGAVIAIIRPRTPTVKLMYRIDTRCTNNQAEAFAILKALEYTKTTQTKKKQQLCREQDDTGLNIQYGHTHMSD